MKHSLCSVHHLYDKLFDPIQRTLTLIPLHSRLELRAGERAGAAVVPDRVLQRRLLRALRLPARPDHAEGKYQNSITHFVNLFTLSKYSEITVSEEPLYIEIVEVQSFYKLAIPWI